MSHDGVTPAIAFQDGCLILYLMLDIFHGFFSQYFSFSYFFSVREIEILELDPDFLWIYLFTFILQ